jgi:hypothetical protein
MPKNAITPLARQIMLHLGLPLVLAILGAALALSGRAEAATAQCGVRNVVIAMFEERYAEHVVAAGVIADGQLLEILASEAGSWTALVTNPQTGMACMVAHGDSWSTAPANGEGRQAWNSGRRGS